jgi:hypothetical protein
MSSDSFHLVTEYPVTDYHCGVRVGDQVRLRHDIVVRDHRGTPTGIVHHAGEVWTVLHGSVEEPPIVWLRQPDGKPHTWSDDSDFLATFELLQRSDSAGSATNSK